MDDLPKDESRRTEVTHTCCNRTSGFSPVIKTPGPKAGWRGKGLFHFMLPGNIPSLKKSGQELAQGRNSRRAGAHAGPEPGVRS